MVELENKNRSISGKVRKVVFAASSTFYGNQELPYRETDHFSVSACWKYLGDVSES